MILWQQFRTQQLKTIKEFQSDIESLKVEEYPVEFNLDETKETRSDPPTILIMRRKWIRQYPNQQRVAIYLVDKINKYITVPYTEYQWSSSGVPVEEESDIKE